MRRMKLTVILWALLAGTVLLTTGCAQPDDGTKTERPSNNNNNENEKPGNENQGNENENTGNGNQNTGNGNQGNGNENAGNGNQGNENENQGNGNENIGNGNEQPADDLVGEAAPYDRNLDKGYVLHNFFGKSPKFQPKTMVDDVNKYLGKAETYMMGLVDGFSQSLSDRPDAKAYFQSYINKLKSNDCYSVSRYDEPYSNLDPLININSQAGDYIFADIIKNLDTPTERGHFYYAFRTLENEASREGYDKYFDTYVDAPRRYERERDLIKSTWGSASGIDLDQDIDKNNCQQVVNQLHTMATKAAQNMGNGITADDLRQVVNIALTANSMGSMHNMSESNLHHTACILNVTVNQTMEDAAEEALKMRSAVQNQGLTR